MVVLFNAKCAIHQHSMARTSYISTRRWIYPLCTRPTPLVGFFFIVLAYWNNSPKVFMSFTQKHCPDSKTTSIYSYTLILCFNGEIANNIYLVFGSTRPRLDCWWLMVFNVTFQQYFSYIVMVNFIGGGNQSTRRNPPTCRKSLTNFIT